MIKYNTCIRCSSNNVDKLMVNTHISLNYPEEKNRFGTAVSQRIITPTDAMVCKDCGHIELFIDLKK